MKMFCYSVVASRRQAPRGIFCSYGGGKFLRAVEGLVLCNTLNKVQNFSENT